jgi:UPF0271 protein
VSTATHTVDLNADVGESSPDADDGLVPLVSTVHIACGFHAGNAETMRHVVERAVESGVAVGAHPSYPDPDGFGRRELQRPPERVAEDVVQQVGALDAMARWCGTRVVSVKAHGALYHRMATDAECAAAVADALSSVYASLSVVLPAEVGDGAVTEARAAVAAFGFATRSEGFCDRGYHRDGSLVAREEPGALIAQPDLAARQACGLTLDHSVECVEGTAITLRPDTLCIHGDTPGAPAIASAVRRALEAADVRVAAFRAGI